MPKPKYRIRVDWNHGGLGAKNTATDFTTAIDDITSDVRAISLTHNRDLKNGVIDAGLLSLELNNHSNDYASTNSSSDLNGLLLPGKPIWAQMFYPYDSFGGGSEAALNGTSPDEDSDWSWVDVAASGTAGSRIGGSFEEDGSGNARVDPTSSGFGNHISYLEFNDKNVQLHAKITTPDRPHAQGGNTPSTANPAYYTSWHYDQGLGVMASLFGFVLRYVDTQNYIAVGFDASENSNISDASAHDRNDKVFLLTYSTDRTVAECDAAATTLTVGSRLHYKIGQHILVEREIMLITSVHATNHTIDVTRGQLGTSARIHGSTSSTTEEGPFKAPVIQFSDLSIRTSDDPTTWRQGATHEVQVHIRGNYVDVTFDGTHCVPDSGLNMDFEFGNKQGDSLYGGMEADSSHTFKLEHADSPAGTKHGLWRSDRAAHSSYYGQSGSAYIDGTEKFEEFGGYRSLFYGYLSSIIPDPDPMNQLAYIEAYDELEAAKRTNVKYAVATNLTRTPVYANLIEILYKSGLFIFGWTAHTNLQATNIIYEPMLTTSGPFSGETITAQYPALKKIDMSAYDLIQIAQIEEDGFIYVDGEGFLRIESQVHREGAGAGQTASNPTWTPVTTNGSSHSDEHNSLTGHIAADHILYGQLTAAATYTDAYGSNNPAYSSISFSEGHEHIENRIQTPVTRSVRVVAASGAVWTSVTAAEALERIELPTGTSYLIVELEDTDSGKIDTANTVIPPTGGDYLVRSVRAAGGGSDVTSSVAVTIESGQGDPYYCAFKLKFVNSSGAKAYIHALILKAGASTVHGGYKLGDKHIVEATDATSITKYGERKAVLRNLFITSPETAQIALDKRLANRKDPKAVVTLTLLGGDKATLNHMIQRRFSDRVALTNAKMSMTAKAFYIEGESWNISDGGTLIEQNLLMRAV